jgi:penicillin amidase
MKMDSQPAAVYASFFAALVNDTFRDQLPQDYWPSGGPENWVTLRALLTDPNNAWWDDTATPAVETRDDILKRAFTEGYAALTERLGASADKWTWGALHTSTFRNQTLGKSGVAPIEALFNRGPYATAGGTAIVNATSFNITKADPYNVTSIPSMRMIVDLSNLANSRAIFSTGESGHAYHPNYIDMADLWRNIQYHPMLWNRPDIEAAAKAHLTLTP